MALIGSKDENRQEGGRDSRKKQSHPRPGVADFLTGEAKTFVSNLQPYLPQDLIGGSLPHISGSEDEAVWNAASQACGTEKVHYVYSVEGGRVWYLACPSASLASNPDSWCPLAAALPGNSEYWDRETVYLYEQEGLASALRWDMETGRMQVFLGASRTILPRVQSMEANFVTVNPNIADIEPWKNRTLRIEKMSRATVRVFIFSGLIVNLLAMLILVVSLISLGFMERDLAEIKENTDKVAHKLLTDASNIMQSDTIRHMVRVQQLLDNIATTNGYLVRYEVDGNKTEWSALVPLGLVNAAVDVTTLREVSDGRARSFAPKTSGVEAGKSDMARIDGKR